MDQERPHVSTSERRGGKPDEVERAVSIVTGPWDGPAVGLLDLDAFFASVEQLDHPEWRCRPVIVGGDPERRGVVSTASYEAREYGVHSAMASAEARRRCPDAIWTHGHFSRYREMSAAIMEIVADETPLVEQVSIDEAFFDITPGRYSRESPVNICARIQRRVAELGVTCSIGLGPNKTVAKIASEREKPRGLTVVPPGQEREFLAPLPVRAMSGIGVVAQERLESLGVRTLGQLSRLDPALARMEFGVQGPRMIERAAGRERSVVTEAVARETPKSVSNERTFSTDLTSTTEARAAIAHLSDMVAMRLMRRGLHGSIVTVRLKRDYAHAKSAQRALDVATRDPKAIAETAWELLGTMWSAGASIRLLGVSVSGFRERDATQLGLFEQDDDGTERRERLMDVRERLRLRFGDEAIAYGHDLRFRDATTGTAPKDKGDF